MRLALALLVYSAQLLADGGAVVFSRQAGPFVVTVFSAPVPLRAGPADISVLLQDVAGRAAVMDADVVLRFSRAGQSAIAVHANHAAAKNKLLYAVQLDLSAGDWQLRVDCAAHHETTTVIGSIHVGNKQPALVQYWPYFVVVPFGLALFALNQWLKATRR